MEIWKKVKDFENCYEVSNLGNVRSLERIVKNKGSYNGFSFIKERILKQSINKYGYHSVTLNKNGKRYFKIVHRLVAEAFIRNHNNYKEVNHKDLNKSNNNVHNLEWCNREQNINHFYKNKNTTSKYKGVSYQKDRNKWIAYLDINSKRLSLGRFNTELEAKKYRENYIKQLKSINYEELI